MVGDSPFPHQLAIQDAVIHVEPAKPAKPRAAGGAIGRRKIDTFGFCVSVVSILASSLLACIDIVIGEANMAEVA